MLPPVAPLSAGATVDVFLGGGAATPPDVVCALVVALVLIVGTTVDFGGVVLFTAAGFCSVTLVG